MRHTGRPLQSAAYPATDVHTVHIDFWVSREQLDLMLTWCHEMFDPADWDYHTHGERVLGDTGGVARFYFPRQDDASAFVERWRR